jgi:hypothetical protein
MSPETREIYGFDRQLVPFCMYRSALDQEPGLMRHGILDDKIYETCINSPSSLFGKSTIISGETIIGATNDILHWVDESSSIKDKFFSTLPSHYLSDYLIPKNMIIRDRLTLSDATSERIFIGDPSSKESINSEIEQFIKVLGRRHSGDTYNEYMFFTKYDLRPTHEKFSKPAEDIETSNGFILSTRPEEIKKYIPEIVNLQREVFNSQAIQTGYFAGISDKATLEILQNPEFIPIIARDKNTNEIAMCTLFSPDFTNFESLTWVNPNEVGRHLMTGDIPDCLTLPLIVVSRLSGLGFLKQAVQMALHETVYRKKPDTVGVMYESNPISVHITPRTIHGQVLRAGGKCLYKHSEVYFMSEEETSAIS